MNHVACCCLRVHIYYYNTTLKLYIIYANNTNPLASTTTIDSNKPITITGLKYWDEATSSWGTRTISAITPSGQASHFEYALRDIPQLVNTEECFLAINITE